MASTAWRSQEGAGSTPGIASARKKKDPGFLQGSATPPAARCIAFHGVFALPLGLFALPKELRQRCWIRVVAAHLNDLFVLDTHELTDRDIKSATVVLSEALPNGHDVLSPNGEVQKLSAERTTAQYPQ